MKTLGGGQREAGNDWVIFFGRVLVVFPEREVETVHVSLNEGTASWGRGRPRHGVWPLRMSSQVEPLGISPPDEGSESSLEVLKRDSDRERLTDSVGEVTEDHRRSICSRDHNGPGKEANGVSPKASKLLDEGRVAEDLKASAGVDARAQSLLNQKGIGRSRGT